MKNDQANTRNKRLPEWVKGILIFIAILYIACAPLAFYLDNSSWTFASVFLLSGAALAIFSRLDDITEFSLLGLNAKVQKVLDETHATIEQVKELAKIMSVSSLSNTARSGWWGGLSDDQRLEILNSTIETLKKLGFNKSEIEQICRDYHNVVLFDYRAILLTHHKTPELIKNEKCRKDWIAIKDVPVENPVSPDQIENLFRDYCDFGAEIKRRLEGYAHYYKHHEFLDFEDWKKRNKWPEFTCIKD